LTDYWNYIAKALLRNFKKLVINYNHKICYNLIAKLIDNSFYLKQIIITTNLKIHYHQDDIGLYIKSISNNCPSLTVFKRVISEYNISEFSQLLEYTNLKILQE